ncbi:MAG: YdjY domain-containing protein, partial [Akkermansiaceae bacterium]|nr:YdjY domain-containing protein [Akkermansiaceae bacterium]
MPVHFTRITGVSLALAACAWAEPAVPNPAPDGNPPAVKPSVERIDRDHFRAGEVTFNHRTREIRFPAEVNMDQGVLEFLLVRTHGKIHESLLVTDTRAEDINLAFKLLRYPASAELYYLPNDRGGLSAKRPEVPEETKAAARVQIKVEWDDGGAKRVVPVNEWLQHTHTGKAMPATLWVYGGSEWDNGGFVAETTGDLVATWITNASLINYPGKDNEDDTAWVVYPKRVPPAGRKVSVIFAPIPELKDRSRIAPEKPAAKERPAS